MTIFGPPASNRQFCFNPLLLAYLQAPRAGWKPAVRNGAVL